MPRGLVRSSLLILLVGLVGFLPDAAAAQAQPRLEGDAAQAALVAREISRLEEARDFVAIANLMHPDSQRIAPTESVVGWYEADLTGRRTAELTVTAVEFVEWTWPVTGQTYARTAAVSFVQPYWTDGVRQDVSGVVHLVKDGNEWGWFFGNSRAFLDQQIALYGSATTPGQTENANPVNFVSGFVNPLDADVDIFWAAVFAREEFPYAPPAAITGFEAAIETGCGQATPNDAVAFYCPADATIYYVVSFRTLIERQVGDFAWVTVIAHEWGHHIQAQLGILDEVIDEPTDSGAGILPVELELQADCLAGAYTQDAEATDWLDLGDIEEALLLTSVAGDTVGTSFDDPNAHGTSQQRVESFLAGYEAGLDGCELELAAAS